MSGLESTPPRRGRCPRTTGVPLNGLGASQCQQICPPFLVWLYVRPEHVRAERNGPPRCCVLRGICCQGAVGRRAGLAYAMPAIQCSAPQWMDLPLRGGVAFRITEPSRRPERCWTDPNGDYAVVMNEGSRVRTRIVYRPRVRDCLFEGVGRGRDRSDRPKR